MSRLLAVAVTAALTITAAWLASAPAAAQQPPPLFVYDAPPSAAALAVSDGGREAIVTRARVGLRLDRLFAAGGAASSVLLNVAERTWIARFERLDLDAAGFRSWVGALDGIPHSHVVFTEREGVVSGLINAVGTTYQIRTERAGAYLLERVEVARLGDGRDAVAAADSGMRAQAGSVEAVSPGVLDVLMLYTPSARAQQGGTAQMQALVAQVISDTNTGFVRSGITSRVRLIAALEFAHGEAADMLTDLFALRASIDVRMMRDAGGADLVQLLVNSPDLSSCGAGYLLESLDDADFPAYSVADIACVPQYTPTHEMGHNLGSNHAPEDAPFGSLFPYSFGYKDAPRSFRTVMAYACADVPCPRILSFSNPALSHNGGPTGSATQDNARSINQAAPVVASFRNPRPRTDHPLPAPPRDLHSDVSGNHVTVRWRAGGASTGTVAYVLQVGTSPGMSDLLNAWVGSATSLSGVTTPGPHYWRVIAVSDAGPGAPSPDAVFTAGPTCVTPLAPENFVFTRVARIVTLRWQPPAPGAAPPAYIVEVGAVSGGSELGRAAAGSLTSVTTSAPPGTYFVRVRAQNACGVSAPSNEQVIVVP